MRKITFFGYLDDYSELIRSYILTRRNQRWLRPEDIFYISTDEVVERYCYRSRNQYFMVTKLRNYSTTAEATMTKFKLSSKAIYLGGNPKKMNFLAVQVTEIFDLNGKPQKG